MAVCSGNGEPAGGRGVELRHSCSCHHQVKGTVQQIRRPLISIILSKGVRGVGYPYRSERMLGGVGGCGGIIG
jgi:hypothetical protein